MDHQSQLTQDTPPEAEAQENPQEAEQSEQISDAEFAETARLIPDGDYHKSPLFYEILNYLGIDKNDDYLVAQKISDLTDFAIVKAKSNQVEDVLSTIRSLEDKMQPGLPGEKREDRLRNYVRILAKKEGLDQKFSKLLTAYEKPKQLTKEDLPPAVKERMDQKMTSLGECGICSQAIEVRDVRQKDKLCPKCEKLKPLMARYQNYQKRGLTQAEKNKILSQHNLSAGSRSYGKR